MSFSQIVNLKGVNFWYLASAIALNLICTLAVALFISMLFLKQVEGGEGLLPVLLMVVTFFGPFLVGWIIGSMAADLRGPTYGVYGSLGTVMVMVVVALPTGLMGIMLIIAAIAGGLNGGLFSLRRRLKGK